MPGMYYPSIQQTVVVDAALHGTAEPKEEIKTRRRETIFGPDVGDDDQPGWTSSGDNNTVSVDVIKRWVERAKSEEVSDGADVTDDKGPGLHTTTTLQALVNLKRPTLLLHPLESSSEADVTTAMSSTPAPPLHVLKFSYDAMTPQVKVTLSLYPAPPDNASETAAPLVPKVLYSGMHPGGFNQPFALPAATALDLTSAIAPLPQPEESAVVDDDKNNKLNGRPSEDTTRSSIDRQAANPTELEVIPELTADEESRHARRFTLFTRRQQRQPDIEQGNIEMTEQLAPATDAPAENNEKPEEAEKEAPEHGMRLVISIEAVDHDGTPLRRRNAQLTHMLVSGTWVPDAGSSPTSGTGKRVWVVKVVRREAQIGAHSFLLKEIYGLSSSAGAEQTYPPSASDPYASTPNECIVCLTSPRDVVLLPCRHLVVCRECAVGMVEFGAGGRVARREEETVTPAADVHQPSPGVIAGAIPSAVPATTIPPPHPPAPRRKKKAKGWYCPVCRQPYTSLLRLALPPSKDGHSADGGVVEIPLSRQQSRGSLRSMRTARSVATLPDGAEAMLSRLQPEESDDEDDHEHGYEYEQARANAAANSATGHVHAYEYEQARAAQQQQQAVPEAERPQFVVGEADISPPPSPAVNRNNGINASAKAEYPPDLQSSQKVPTPADLQPTAVGRVGDPSSVVQLQPGAQAQAQPTTTTSLQPPTAGMASLRTE